MALEKFLKVAVIVVTILISSFQVLKAGDFCNTTMLANGMDTYDTIYKIIYAKNSFWSITRGEVMKSEDCVNWQTVLENSDPLSPFCEICYNGDFFVVLVSSYPRIVFKSSDGLNWTPITLGQDELIYDICFFNGKFYSFDRINGGGGVKIFISSDALSWKEIAICNDEEGYFQDAGLFPSDKGLVMFGTLRTSDDRLKSCFFISEDGENWQKKSKIEDIEISSMAYCNNKFYLSGNNDIFASDNLEDFENVFEYDTDQHGTIYKIVSAGNSLYAFYGPMSPNYMHSGPDGKYHFFKCDQQGSWNEISTLTAPGILEMIFADNRIVLGGFLGYRATSVDGINWNEKRPFTYCSFYNSTHFKDRFLLLGIDTNQDKFKSCVYSIYDGENWEKVFEMADLRFKQMASNKDICVIASDGGELYYTKDGRTFFSMGTSDKFCLGIYDIAINNDNVVVIVGINNFNGVISSVKCPGSKVVKSYDFTDMVSVNSVTTDGNKFVAIGKAKSGELVIIRKESGKKWKRIKLNRSYFPYDNIPFVRYGDGKFILVAADGEGIPIYLYSNDGINWQRKSCDSYISQVQFKELRYSNKSFIGIGINLSPNYATSVFVSNDGFKWDSFAFPHIFESNTITYWKKQFIVGGYLGLVLKSDCKDKE